MNIIGHMANYYREEFFGEVMAMNVTVMLVLTTLFLRKVQRNVQPFYFMVGSSYSS